MKDVPVDVGGLEQQLAGLAIADGEALEILSCLAGVAFHDGRANGAGAVLERPWPRPARREPGDDESSTENINTEERLAAKVQQSEARFRSLVEQLPAVVFYAALGDGDNEVYVSPQIENLLGFTQREWVTNPLLWYSQLHPDDHDAVIAAFTLGVQTGGPFRAEARFWARDGEEVWILGEARLIRDDAGRVSYFQGVAFDITATKRAQAVMAEAQQARAEAAQLRADAYAASNIELTRLNDELRVARDRAETAAQARTTFLTTMSHELRTPLNSVVVLSGLLADGPLAPAQRDLVRHMQLASDHLLEVINDVLEFSRLRAGQVELERRPFELGTWLADTIDIVSPRAVAKGLVLVYHIADDVPRRLISDDNRLRQVLLNLLANAVKFTAEGGVSVEVTARPVEAGAMRTWEFTCAVSDTGVGVDSSEAETLFGEFRQSDSGIAREFGGTGLGLAICKRLCELLDGRIWIDRGSGQGGATFVFTWVAEVGDLVAQAALLPPPARLPDPGDNRTAAVDLKRCRPGTRWSSWRRALRPAVHSRFLPRAMTGAGRAGRSGSPVRILLVDDDLMNQHVATLLLGAMGHRADVVASGDDAIAAVTAAAYDVVLMDVAMPVTDGLSATRSIRRLGEAIHQPYIVALTANALPGDAEACIEAGMDDYLAKPIDRSELARAVAAASDGPGSRSLADGSDVGGLSPDRSSGKPGTMRSVPDDGGPAGGGHAVPEDAGLGPPGAGAAGYADAGFDPALLLGLLRQFGPESLRRVLVLFATEAVKLVDAESVAVAAGDAENAVRPAHTLKSSAANVGAVGLAAVCAELETMARSGSLEGADSLVAEMHSHLEATTAHLAAFEARVAEG